LNTQPISKPEHSPNGFLSVHSVWVPVVGWRGLYEVSDLGEIRSLPRKIKRNDGQSYTVRGRILKPTPCCKRKYLCVELNDNGYAEWNLVHIIVLTAFEGKCPPDMQSCHKDGNGWNNKRKNLRWGTAERNADDRDKHGRTVRGEKMHSAKLTLKKVSKIKRELKAKVRQVHIAKKHGVSRSTITDIKKERTWIDVK
jgi:hypothetical protein